MHRVIKSSVWGKPLQEMKDYARGICINYVNRNPFMSVQSFDLSLALEANMIIKIILIAY